MLPSERPGKIVCVGLNYRDHAEEQGVRLPAEPLLFAKCPSALAGDPIVIPPLVTQCDSSRSSGSGASRTPSSPADGGRTAGETRHPGTLRR